MPMVKNFCRFNLGFYESEVIKMCNVKNILAAMLLVFAATIFGSAEAAIVTDKMPLQCYVDHKVTSYDTRSGQAVGWIDAEVDLVKIRGIDGNGVAIGTHPGRNGTVERLFWARDVFADTNYSNRNAHVNGYHDVYRTSTSGSTIGSVKDEDVTVVADNGNRAQIIYRLNNGTGYKMGWVPSNVVKPSDPNKADFRLDSYGVRCSSDYQLSFGGRVWNANNNSELTGIHVYVGGDVGAGGEFIGEFQSNSYHVFQGNLNVPQHRTGNQLVVIYAVNGKDAAELDRRYVNISPSQTNENWDNKIGQKLANENSEHYQKPTNPFNKSYTSSRDGSYHATNCTWYAWGRMREITGKNLSVRGNAGTWHNSTNWDSNLTSKCVAERTTKKGGHVVFVEYVDNDRGRVYYTECNWNVKDDYKVQVADINTFKSIFKWFIH